MNRPPEQPEPDRRQHGAPSRFRTRRAWLIGGLALVLVVGVGVAVVLLDRPGARHLGSRSGGVPTPTSATAPEPSAAASTASPSASPSRSASHGPSATPPAGANPHQPNCAPHPVGCGFPDASNTGVPAGTKLTVVNGDMEVRQAGAVIDGKDIRGCVDVMAANVTIRRSKISCTSYYVVGSFAEEYKGGGLVIEDSDIDCRSTNTTGIGSFGFTARRLNIHGCENGFDLDSSATVVDSYLHDFYEGTSGHADGVQLSVGTHIVVSHNTILDAIGTSAMISNGSSISDVLVTGNLMAGGAYTLYCPAHGSSAYRVVNNRFSTLYYAKGGAYGPLSDCDKVAEFSGNVWDTTLKPLTSTS